MEGQFNSGQCLVERKSAQTVRYGCDAVTPSRELPEGDAGLDGQVEPGFVEDPLHGVQPGGLVPMLVGRQRRPRSPSAARQFLSGQSRFGAGPLEQVATSHGSIVSDWIRAA